MKRIVSLLLLLAYLCLPLVACRQNDEYIGESEFAGEIDSDAYISTSATGETSVVPGTEADTEYETMGKTDLSVFEVNPALPVFEATLTYSCADGMILNQYDGCVDKDFYAAGAYYLVDGYEVYCSNNIGETMSLTVTKDDAYRTLFFSGRENILYIGSSESGAASFPEVTESYVKEYDVTVTQNYSARINGMGYIIRLADGSFIVYDGGYVENAEELYKTLRNLNGKIGRIYIRAWVLTHSHTDHFSAFSQIAESYAHEIKLDTVIYAPANNLTDAAIRNGIEYFSDTLAEHVARFEGAKLCPVHTGMSFSFPGVKLEILMTSEQLSRTAQISDSNNTSTVSRIVGDGGSMIFLGDIGAAGCEWMLGAYDDALKSDMVQVSHHGCETATAEFYDKVAAPLLFWPCNEMLFGQYRGELVKQHLIEADYSVEHILHEYGTITRSLSYKPDQPEYIDLFPEKKSLIRDNSCVENVSIEGGVLKYRVTDAADPYVSVLLLGIDTGKCNMLRIVAGADDCEGSGIYVTYGNTKPGAYSEIGKKDVGRQGTSDDGKMTLLVYLGNMENFNGELNAVRFDFGTQNGQTVEIYSIEAYYVDMDSKKR